MVEILNPNKRPFVDELIDDIIDQVNKEYPSDGDARLKVYHRVCESLLGLVDALSPRPVQPLPSGFGAEGVE